VSRKALNKRKRKPGASLWQTVRASKDASVFTVFIEDSAALIGLVVAALGIALGQLLRQPLFRPGGLVLIGLLLVGAAFTLARETGALLVGESIGPDATRKVREVFERRPGDPAWPSCKACSWGRTRCC
jgi:divalent metal cation (Fe/Co/Zn/Cd) transporter